ncbi:hypothetical protein PIB30_047487 [Stylosanthes scabra]|uniref:Uncharacterized protein n=1 Tax=Stylosanthes scabra TaxID=79078 RepID=A0ABU6SGN6_9FABA|nr:hypothetical protein [Stylosanthes scabra]
MSALGTRDNENRSAGTACRLWSLRGCLTFSVESQNFQAGPWQRSPRHRAVRSNQRWRPTTLRKTAGLLPLRSVAMTSGGRAYWDDGVCRRQVLSSMLIIGCVRRGGGRWTRLNSPFAGQPWMRMNAMNSYGQHEGDVAPSPPTHCSGLRVIW